MCLRRGVHDVQVRRFDGVEPERHSAVAATSTHRGVAIACIACEMGVMVMAVTAGLAAWRWSRRGTRDDDVQAVDRWSAPLQVGGGDQVGRRKLRWCASIAAVVSAWCSQRDCVSVAARPRVVVSTPVSPSKQEWRVLGE